MEPARIIYNKKKMLYDIRNGHFYGINSYLGNNHRFSILRLGAILIVFTFSSMLLIFLTVEITVLNYLISRQSIIFITHFLFPERNPEIKKASKLRFITQFRDLNEITVLL